IYKNQKGMPIPFSGKLTQEEITELADFIFTKVKNHIYSSPTNLLFLDLTYEIGSTDVVFLLSAFTGDLSNPNFLDGDGLDCLEDAFASDDCFRMALGDVDFFGELSTPGGLCNEPGDYTTSAQEE